jgi:hypothetical protein
MTQSELSRLEWRADLRLSTLRRYVEALGDELEISVVVGKRKLNVTEMTDARRAGARDAGERPPGNGMGHCATS